MIAVQTHACTTDDFIPVHQCPEHAAGLKVMALDIIEIAVIAVGLPCKAVFVMHAADDADYAVTMLILIRHKLAHE